ncbi:dihydrofolate reductase family protein [Oenococcus kitaharae]|uniref:Dihydrofolate reductase n=1 Tax=Oenococcus kitaharae DSM 17330 TaxID=1045004 RepID=G9WFN5_9LACO|nr:dihydrofolate reductase family protein [Oenococcus kitaharae]EHN59327.1 Dihydrofolate reductase [Oenococcus kitaharae DSM 17330]OEY82156.1 deaminase/reductase [Oenococcus kitaharae]OEY82579.1 deaminase/reductase [Oenococcus kitaharae]OEY84834.1 deaminase/reductase [Oenococcus kitaharae]
MAKLIYAINESLDGYIEDRQGSLDWSVSDDELFSFWTDFQRSIGTYLYGRRMYDAMVYWENPSGQPFHDPKASQEFSRIWRNAHKTVFSRTLEKASTGNTEIVHAFDADQIRQLKASAAEDLTIGGPDFAGQALKAGLVDDCYFLVNPIILGGGKRALPENHQIQLQLLDLRRFRSGVVMLHYRVAQ